MAARFGALVLAIVMITGCVTHVFNEPTTISTSTAAVEDVERLGRVQVGRCDYLILMLLPIIRDPRGVFDDLLREAKTKGGNAVVDFELRSTSSFSVIPLYLQMCSEAVGEAAKFEAN